MSWFPHIVVHTVVKIRLLLSIFKAGAGNIYLWFTDCHPFVTNVLFTAW